MLRTLPVNICLECYDSFSCCACSTDGAAVFSLHGSSPRTKMFPFLTAQKGWTLVEGKLMAHQIWNSNKKNHYVWVTTGGPELR